MEMIMLIGVPGSGKSTICQEYINKGYVVHSSDNIREELFGDASIQNNPALVFNTLHSRIIRDLNNGKNVVYDACNTSKNLRVKNLCIIKEKVHNVNFKAVLMNTDIDVCKERNSKRSRVVPDEVIDRMYSQLISAPPSLEDGFDEIATIN